jgi:hypothetical protein
MNKADQRKFDDTHEWRFTEDGWRLVAIIKKKTGDEEKMDGHCAVCGILLSSEYAGEARDGHCEEHAPPITHDLNDNEAASERYTG